MTDEAKISVVPMTAPDVSKLISILEEATEDARSGRITGLVLITTLREKEWRGQWSGVALNAAMGYLARVTYKINRDWDDSV